MDNAFFLLTASAKITFGSTYFYAFCAYSNTACRMLFFFLIHSKVITQVEIQQPRRHFVFKLNLFFSTCMNYLMTFFFTGKPFQM